MKLNKNQIFATICLGLMLTMTIPVAFSQILAPVPKIAVSTVVDVKPWTVSVGQNVLIQGLLYPPPAYDIYVNITITRPNGTQIIFTRLLSGDIKETKFLYQPDEAGLWTVAISFPGDEFNRATSQTFRKKLTVTTEVQPLPPATRATKSYLGTVPIGKVGVGDGIYVVGWVSPPRELQGGIFHTNFEFIITKPDGTKETFSKKPDSPATASFTYICSQPGTYSAVMSFAGDDYLLFKFLPSASPTTTWVAEQDYHAPQYPGIPLPSEAGPINYPVSMEYYDWFYLAGEWQDDPSQICWNQYTKGPETPHVLWVEESSNAGIMNGKMGQLSMNGGVAGVGVVWQGNIWRTGSRQLLPSTTTTIPGTVPTLTRIDQLTGQKIWTVDLPGTGSGGTIYLELSARQKIDPRQEVTEPQTVNMWIVGGGLRLVNPWTGVCSYYNSTFTPTKYYDGSFWRVSSNATDGQSLLMRWDTATRSDVWTGVKLGTDYRTGDYIDTSVNPPVWVRTVGEYGGWPIALKVSSWNALTGAPIAVGKDIPAAQCPEGVPSRMVVYQGKFYIHADDMRVHAIDIYTGKVAWVSDKTQIYPWGDFNAYNTAAGYNMVYFDSWDGHIYAYDTATGKEVWKGYSADAYQETAMGTYPFYSQTVVGDGKVYGATSQHTEPNPFPRGDSLVCFDAFTGRKIWQLFGFSAGGAESLANGILTYGNQYTGQLFAFGKGPSKVTVSAPNVAVPLGTPVLIQGTVTDQSPGSPNTPAIADANQGEWVQYLYMNKAKPAMATGVTVFLQAINVADGTLIDLWHVTSDNLGCYEYAWTPQATGTYKILATFEGSGAYYSSSAEAPALIVAAGSTPVVTPAPTETPPTPTPTPIATASPSPAPQPDATPSTDIYIIAAALVAIIVVAIAAVFLRKRK